MQEYGMPAGSGEHIKRPDRKRDEVIREREVVHTGVRGRLYMNLT